MSMSSRTSPASSVSTPATLSATHAPRSVAEIVVLTLLALAGVASLLTSDLGLGSIAEQAGIAEDQVRLLVLIQPAILVLVAVVVGWRTSRRTGLTTPILNGGPSAFRGGALSAAGAVAVLAGALLTTYTYLTTSVVALDAGGALSTSLLTRLLYGGITEEVLIRWGLMGLFAWLLLRFVPNADVQRGRWIWIANLAAALLFALGHFPALAVLADAAPVHYALSFVVNVVAGLGFGWVFARFGLEYAFVAHAGTHLIAFVATLSLL